MKKLFSTILVICSLLGGNAYGISLKPSSNFNGQQAEAQGKIYIGQDKFNFCESNNVGGFWGEYMCWFSRRNSNDPNLYYYGNNYEIIISGGDRRAYVFKGVYNPIVNGWEYGGKLVSIHSSMTEARASITKTKKNLKEKSPKITPDNNKVVPAGSGSGFFVSSDGHIITNHHVINGCNTTKVSFKGNQIEAQILAVDKMNDIAILKTNIKPDSIFPISNEDVSLLEDVVVAGYPLGKQVSSAIKTHKGVVTALAGAGDNYSNFQTDASINAGNSGGPIMNQKGNIVGIAVATWVQDGVQGVHFGIKSSTLKTFANSNSLKFSSPNYLELSNKDLGKLITDATVYLECHMTVANIKKMMATANNRKAFFSEFK